MQLVDELGHRALAFVLAAQRQGYEMTHDELDAYMSQPHRRAPVPGMPARTAISTNVGRSFQESIQKAIGPTLEGLWRALEVERREIPGRPEVPGESAREWLVRLGWISEKAGRLRVTALGTAILAHLEQEDLEDEIPIGVVLDQGDELATARVIQKIAELGPCSVVDPYFSMESLLPILQSTEVGQVLTGSHDLGKLSGLEVALGTVEPDRDFEVRKSSVFHDRFVLPQDGPPWLLGTSFTGLGKRLSVMVEIQDEAVGTAINNEFERAWQAAEPVALDPPEESSIPSEGD